MDEKELRIYEHASNWLRMANTMAWTLSGIFVPLTLGCFVFAINKPDYAWLFGAGSIFLYGVWSYLTFFYGLTAKPCRKALMELESKWALAKSLRIYENQGFLYKKPYGAAMVQAVAFVFICVGWVILLQDLPP